MFDPFELAGAADPYTTYRWLREEAPVFHNPTRGFWALSRFEDVRAASRDWGTFSNADGVDLDELGTRVFGPGDFLDTDPPEHDELRAVVRSHFTPKAIAALEPLVRSHARRRLDELSGGGDAVQQLAWPLPIDVMCSIMGFPTADRGSIGRRYARVIERKPGDASIPREALEAAAELRDYFVAMAGRRRERPEDDVITAIAQGVVGGEPLSERKLTGMCFVLFSAGIDTVASLLGNAILLLGERPEARRHDLAVAIEEVLRYESPLQFNARTTTVEATVAGARIPAGERVLLLYGSANRDERRFEAPDVFDVGREPKRHLAFGEGIHFCIGAPLARLQTRVALEDLLSRFPGYEIAGPPQRAPAYNMRSLSSLPVSFTSIRLTAP